MTAYNVGIYCRLSREDLKNGKKDESLSITNQRDMLVAYANQQGWSVYKVYPDDDVTGTTFQRKRFQEMMDDIEAGKVNCVITKDLSRLGRNYLEAGRYREFFIENGVRYIAIHDNYDNAIRDSYDIATPIKEIVNEMYAADISRKVRSTKKLMAEQGKFSNSRAPYGYAKSKENKHVLVVDDKVSHNVVRIFDLYLSGMPARAIADVFNREGILPPNEYFYSVRGLPNPYKNNKNSWGSGSIMGIIKNPAYYGAISNGKREVKSFKNKKISCKSFDDWVIVENTHEPIISKERWLEARSIGKKNKRETVRRSADGEVSIFAGIIKCSDCGGNMIFNRKELKSCTSEFYRCGTYQQKGKAVCPPHRIDFDVLYQAVLSDIREYAVLAVEDETKLIDRIIKENDDFRVKNVSRYEKHIREGNNRIREIDGLVQSLFEEKQSGNVSGEMFKRMTAKYEDEQRKLVADVEQMETELDECKRVQQDLSGWIARIKECLTIDTLTRAIAVEMIERIEVSETYNVGGEKTLDLEIFYKFGLKSDNHGETEKRAS